VSILSVQLDWLSVLDVAELFTDGTTNFIHGFPFVCISLGLIYERRPILGVIYNPFLNHLVSLWLAYMPVCARSDKCTVYRHKRPRFIPYTGGGFRTSEAPIGAT
jgi:hypothetical protein